MIIAADIDPALTIHRAEFHSLTWKFVLCRAFRAKRCQGSLSLSGEKLPAAAISMVVDGWRVINPLMSARRHAFLKLKSTMTLLGISRA